MSELGISSKVLFPLETKECVIHEFNPDGSFYKGCIGQGPGSLYTKSDRLYYSYLYNIIDDNKYLSDSFNNIPLLRDNKELILKEIAGYIDVHNYITKPNNERTLSEEELKELLYKAMYYVFQVKRYKNGERLIDYVEPQSLDNFTDEMSNYGVIAYDNYNEAKSLLEEDELTIEMVDLITDEVEETVDELDITYLK